VILFKIGCRRLFIETLEISWSIDFSRNVLTRGTIEYVARDDKCDGESAAHDYDYPERRVMLSARCGPKPEK
jgi:hypothetical protein